MVAFVVSLVISVAGTYLVLWYAKRRPVGAVLTWGEAMAASTFAFLLMFWVYGVVPHQWLQWAGNELGWRTDKTMIGWHLPFTGQEGIVEYILPFQFDYEKLRDIIVSGIYVLFLVLHVAMWMAWQNRGKAKPAEIETSTYGRPLVKKGRLAMARTDANPPMPEFRTDYVLQEVDADYLARAVKPKQFIHIDQSECIICEGCVDICPWKCIHMQTTDAIAEAVERRAARRRPERPHHLHDRRRRVHPVRALRRPLPHRGDHPRQVRRRQRRRRPPPAHDTHGYGYGMRLGVVAKTMGDRPGIGDRVSDLTDKMQGSQAWNSIFRPGSIFRKGYTDSPRNRSYVIMNCVLYHLHPVKVKRHAVKVSYTLCLGGLSFFLFILLTVTGIFLMFFYRPTAAAAWDDIAGLHTAVAFGLLVRNMHRWAAHLMVISVFLHMARVFYHGAYKPPREFNWVIGVILLTLTLLLSFTGYLLPWDQLALWAVTVGTNMMGYTPGVRETGALRAARRRGDLAPTRCCGGTCSTC